MDSADLEQGTAEWRAARLGFITASRIHDVLTKPRKKGQAESSARRNYKAQLVVEILSGKSSKDDDVAPTWWQKRGTELEPEARDKYEFRTGSPVLTCGFVQHPLISRYGCSPDGLIGDYGMAQIKCLNRANHIECVTSGIPDEHLEQMVCELSVCPERKWSDFVSYHPEFPEPLNLCIRRIERSDHLGLIVTMEKEVSELNAEIDRVLADLKLAMPGGLQDALERSLELSQQDVETAFQREL